MWSLERVGPVLAPASRLILGATFLIAGIDKAQAPGAFAEAVRAFHLLPPSLVLPFAYILPWLEILVAAYLLAGFMSRLAASGAIVLLGGFVFALGTSLARGDIHHACGCFGSEGSANPILVLLSGGSTITWWDLIRDLLLIGLAALILVLGSGPLSLDALLARRRDEFSDAAPLIPGRDEYQV